MSVKIGRGMAAGAVAILVVAGIVWKLSGEEPVAVTVATVAPGVVEDTVANTRAGTVKACRRARLSPLIAGKVAKLPIHRGDRVKKGDLLLSLWNEDISSRLALSRSETKAAQDRAQEACLRAEQAQREAARLAALKSQGIATEEVYDRAATAAQAGQAACQAAKGAVEVARAQVEVAQAELDRTVLTAPFPGVVAEVNAELFEMVTPSPVGVPTPPAVDLIDDSCLYVSAPIDEVDAPRVKTGMPARVALDAFAGQTFPGTVRRVAPYVLDVEKQSRTVEVEVDFQAPEAVPWMLPGLSADAELILEARSGVPRIPSAAVLGENRVLLVAGDTLIEKNFSAGLANWEYTEVREGLQAGDRVVTSLERDGVAPGARVIVERAP